MSNNSQTNVRNVVKFSIQEIWAVNFMIKLEGGVLFFFFWLTVHSEEEKLNAALTIRQYICLWEFKNIYSISKKDIPVSVTSKIDMKWVCK